MAGEGVLEITDANFDEQVLKSSQPVLVDFWATWCPPCRALGPVIDELAKEFAGKVKVGKVDADVHQQSCVQYGITALPTILLFKDGQIVRKFVGLAPKREFVSEMQKVSG
jgi:thioredoxin 1